MTDLPKIVLFPSNLVLLNHIEYVLIYMFFVRISLYHGAFIWSCCILFFLYICSFTFPLTCALLYWLFNWMKWQFYHVYIWICNCHCNFYFQKLFTCYKVTSLAVKIMHLNLYITHLQMQTFHSSITKGK